MLALKQILLLFLLFYSLLLLFLYLQQKSFIFFPTKARHNVSGKNIAPYSLSQDQIQLKGWLLNPSYVGDRLFIYYGGNAEDIFFAFEQFKEFGNSAALLVNYRGYGISGGSPGEKEMFADALAVFDDIRKTHSPGKIFLMGRSLGSGIASYVGSKRNVDGVILATPFYSIESLAKKQFPYLPVSKILKHKFLSSQYVKNISAPCLVIYGGRDNTVPPENTRRLIKNIAAETTVVFIEEAEHNNIELFDNYNLAILQFIQ